MAVSSPSSAPEKKRKWLLSNRKVIDRYLREARAILAAAPESGGGDAVAALGLVDAALRMEASMELRARALLVLRRYREVAEMLRDYIPSCGKSCSGEDTSSSSSSLSPSSSGDLGTISRAKLLSPDRHRSDVAEPDTGAARSFRCFDVSELKSRVLAGLSKKPNTDTQWRYLVLGQACFHLGLIEDAMVLLQTGRCLASAAFRRESVCWSEDSFSSSAAAAVAASVPSFPSRPVRRERRGRRRRVGGERRRRAGAEGLLASWTRGYGDEVGACGRGMGRRLEREGVLIFYLFIYLNKI